MALLNLFVDTGICPNVIRKGRNILLIELPDHHIRFLCSNNYLTGDQFDLANQFGVNYDRQHFPKHFLNPANFTYVGEVPSPEYFFSWNDSSAKKEEIIKFISKFKDQQWIFLEALLSFENQKLFLLAESLLIFLKESFYLQYLIKDRSPSNLDELNLVNPFNSPLCSLSSFVFLLFKFFYLNKLPIYAVAYEYGKNAKPVSKLEYEYCSFMDYKFPEQKFQYAFNHRDGPKYFKESVPDLYSPITNELFYFHGCFYHAHYENCLINKKATAETLHPFGKSYKQINLDFFKKMDLLMKIHSKLAKIPMEGESTFLEKKKKSDTKLFFDHHFRPHCLKRLRPRDAVRGAFSDVYAFKWSQAQFPNESFFCTDINGLYSFCAINFPFMVGKYDILIGKDLQKLTINNGKFLFNNNSVMGAILVKILPPQCLIAPFLLYRKKNNSVVNTLCKQCAETNSKQCFHSNEERSWIGTYMISEIEFALKLNYSICQIYEAHVYTDSAFILRDFIQKLNFLKTKYTDCFENITSHEEQLKYCSYLNNKMKLDSQNFILKPETITPNPARRYFYKLLCNALFGKFIQRSDKTDMKFVNTQDEINDTYFSPTEILDFICPNENICLLFVKKNVLKLPPNRKINVYIGSQITAFARQVIYEHLQTILSLPNFKVYQVECDSIYFSGPKNAACPLPLSHAVGDFKIELSKNVLNFYSLGPKHYCVNFLDESNKIQNICKFSGLSLQNELNQTIITHETFEKFLNDFINHTESYLNLHQLIKQSDFKTLKISENFQKFTIRNNISNRRYLIDNTERMLTLPYGFLAHD